MNPKELVGRHELSGVDHLYPDAAYNMDADVLRFTLDGVHYLATEDPNDGYRSMLGSFEVVADGPVNRFESIPVVLTVDGESYDAKDYDLERFTGILEMRDARNGEVILQVGTVDWDDYYPYCVMRWSPESIAASATSGTDSL
jgi:hypothetical protein